MLGSFFNPSPSHYFAPVAYIYYHVHHHVTLVAYLCYAQVSNPMLENATVVMFYAAASFATYPVRKSRHI